MKKFLTKMSKRIFTQITHPELQVVNASTGEIVSAVADIKCSTIDEFIMCFMSSIPQVVQLDGNTIRVLMWCWKFSSFNPSIPEANTITNDKAFKERIREEEEICQTQPLIKQYTPYIKKRCSSEDVRAATS